MCKPLLTIKLQFRRIIVIEDSEYAKFNDLVRESGFNGALLMVRDQLMYFNRLYFPNKYYLACKERLFTINLSILLNKLSCLTTEINQQIEALTSNGLIDKWASDLIALSDIKHKIINTGPKQLNNEQLMGAYQLFFAGILFSVVVFVLELKTAQFVKLKKLMNFLNNK